MFFLNKFKIKKLFLFKQFFLGVGFRVGGNSKNNFLILQIHYMHATKDIDYSGVSVISTIVPQPRTAATLLLVTGGEIKPKSTGNKIQKFNLNFVN